MYMAIEKATWVKPEGDTREFVVCNLNRQQNLLKVNDYNTKRKPVIKLFM